VPITAEIFKKHGVYDPKRIIGVTTLDVVRANGFLAEAQGWDARKTDVTVVGGHAGITILPLFSQVKNAKLTAEAIDKLTVRVQFGGDEVVKAKDGAGSATLSMAYAGARFVHSMLRGLSGEKGVTECAYVASDAKADVPYFATRVELGRAGVEKIHPIGPVSAYEQSWIDKMVPELKAQIAKGVEFAAGFVPK
jgi:malate dehydrogenase